MDCSEVAEFGKFVEGRGQRCLHDAAAFLRASSRRAIELRVGMTSFGESGGHRRMKPRPLRRPCRACEVEATLTPQRWPGSTYGGGIFTQPPKTEGPRRYPR